MYFVNSMFNLYDANGNMTADLNKGVSLTYNRLNLPLQAVFPYRRSTAYVHGADGTKLRVTHSTGMLQSGGVPSVILLQPTVTTTDYCGNLLFENGELSRLLVDGGYVTFTNGMPHYHFHLKDHLGSSRVVFSETGVVEQETQYYPYGGIMADLSTGQDAQRHKYNGKELDRMHGLDWYDYGARHYDAVLGRWTTMDPLCEKYYDVSPYANCFGNPVKYVDIYGMAPGDRFKNPIQAAIDFGITYNVESIQTNKELSSFIYKMKDKNGKTYYTYPGPAKGSKANVSKEDMKSIDRSKISVNEFIDVVANIHTHGSELGNYENNIFSGEQATPEQNKEWRGEKRRGSVYKPDDISEANRTQTYSYVVTPNGELRGYDPKTGIVKVWSTQMPTSDKDVNNTRNTEPNNSLWERFIRFIESL